MADFLVIGALAVDRPVWLSGPVAPGARLRGRTEAGAPGGPSSGPPEKRAEERPDGRPDGRPEGRPEGRLGGRLGGGGANAGVALVRAGHRAALMGFVAEDGDGEAALAAARAAGLDTRRVGRRAGASPLTLILIDPEGERMILHLDAEASSPPALAPPETDLALDGLYVRAPYPGAGAWAAGCRGPVVAHWPAGGFEGPCDVLVASAADCDAAVRRDPFAAGRAQVGAGLQWMVMTSGAGPVIAYGPSGSVSATPPQARVVDATGAGDVFAAGLLEALAAGAPMEAALTHACAWGAEAVGLEGSAPLAGVFAPFRPVAP